MTRCNSSKTRNPELPEKKCIKCEDCGKEFKNKSNFTRHRKEVHRVEEIGELQCSFENCPFSTNDPKYLKRHTTLIHSNPDVVKCQNCEYECLSKSGLLKHIASHHNKKCSLCEEVFSSDKKLKQHMFMKHRNISHVYDVTRSIGEHSSHQLEPNPNAVSTGLGK